jgi:signal transduction histidine kinase
VQERRSLKTNSRTADEKVLRMTRHIEEESVVSYLQARMEHENAALAHHLHDDLGGLLVGALMDVSWAEQHLTATDGVAREKLLRARQSLSAAIDIKRRVIEQLRPTLLDNVGLLSAIQWLVKDTWGKAGVHYTESYPGSEPSLAEGEAIIVFRVVQGALSLTMTGGAPNSAAIAVSSEADVLTLQFSGGGSGFQGRPNEGVPTDGISDEYVALQYRVRRLHGDVELLSRPGRADTMAIRIPLHSLAVKAAA